MTPLLFVVAAGVGAMGRHVVGQFACSWVTLLWVNSIGAGLLGLIVASELSPSTTTILGVGFYALVTVGSACAAASIGTTLV